MHDLLERLTSALGDRYAVEKEIGRGGMAVVFLAEDLRHHRQVAIKVLHPELTATLGADRFLHEIEIVAGLQHPQILPLYDSGEAEGLLYYVMPHLEGDSLRDRLDRERQLPVEDTVRIAGEVAEALSYAHERGVIHRDIKPENILFQADRALLADFGIALAVTAAAGTRLTETGLSLGTLRYVSPEQASGDRELDARTDIYSLAAVVYESLAGEPPHSGGTSQSIIARVISERPDPVSRLRPSIPRNVSDAVQRGLAKTPADRFTSAAQFGAALRDPSFTWSPGGTPSEDQDPDGHKRVGRLGVMSVAAALATAILGLALGYQFAPRSGGPRVYDVVLPDSAPIFFTGGSPWGEGWPALTIAPNGDFVVYVAERGSSTELWYRSLSDTESYPIPGTEGAYQPMMSPDGDEVAFFVGDRLRRISVTGEGATTITTVDLPWGGQWSADGHIWVADENGYLLRRIDPAGASPVGADSPVGCVLPGETPVSSLVLCGERHILSLVDADAGTRVALQAEPEEVAAAGNVVFGGHGSVVSGHYLLYLSISGELKATLFDHESARVGRSTTLETGIRREGIHGAGQYALGASGTLAYVPGDNAEVGRLVRASGGGKYEPLPIGPAAFQRFDLSRDGRRLVAVIQELSGQELWVYDLETGRGMRWLQAYYVGQPRWDPDSRRILVDVIPEHGRARRSVIGSPDASAPPDTLEGTCSGLSDYVSDDLILGNGLKRCSIEARRVSADTLDLSGGFGTVSPDRKWISYSSIRTGRFEVYIASFPSTERRFQVSDGGGLESLWVSSSELVYRAGHTWYRARIAPEEDQPIKEVSPWFADPRFVDTNGYSHLLAPDGGLIYVRTQGLSTATSIRVVPKWLETMKRAVDEANAN